MDRHEEIMSQITELLDEFSKLDTKNKLLSDKYGYIHMHLNHEIEDFNMVILGSQHIFRTMIWNMLHENELAANDIMEIVEAFRESKFN